MPNDRTLQPSASSDTKPAYLEFKVKSSWRLCPIHEQAFSYHSVTAGWPTIRKASRFTARIWKAGVIGYIDLTHPPFRESSRHPRTQAGGCAGGPSAARQVTVTLQALDKTIYRFGEEITFEIGIQNTGKEVILVPWTPDLADLEPSDPKAGYKYLIGVVILQFKDPKDHIFSLSESLYGSPNVPGTIRDLPPGQSFTVRGRTKIENLWPREWGKEELAESSAVDAKVSGHFREDNRIYSTKDGGKLTESCIPMRSTKANEQDVTLEFR